MILARCYRELWKIGNDGNNSPGFESFRVGGVVLRVSSVLNRVTSGRNTHEPRTERKKYVINFVFESY